MVVIIIERSAEIAERLIELIREKRPAVTIYKADSYTEAKLLIEANDAEAVLLDLDFPGNHSLDLLQLIKTKNKKTVAVVLYNFAIESQLQQCRDYGADYILSKYEDFEKLPIIVSTL